MRKISIELFGLAGAKVALATALVLMGATANAAVTYVDAILANTDNAAGGADSTWVDGDDGSTGGTAADGAAANDGLWRFRGGFGNGGIFEATGSNSTIEDAVEIVTTATGLADGLYNAYVFFYPVDAPVAGVVNFPIRARFAANPNANTLFDAQGDTDGAIAGQDASLLSYDVPPPTGGETRTLLYGLVGQTAVSGGTLSVYVDDYPANPGGTSRQRTWYAGIGYQLVPEPGALGLAVLCVATCLIGARRARRLK